MMVLCGGDDCSYDDGDDVGKGGGGEDDDGDGDGNDVGNV